MLNISITNDCKYLNIIASTYTGGAGAADISITNGSYSYTTFLNLSAQGTVSKTILTSDIGTDSGVFYATLTQNGTSYGYRAVLGTCDVDCCLAKRMKDLLDCSCDCSKCATQLAQSQKIFLLIYAAKVSLNQLGENASNNEAYILDAENKHLKAVEICGGECGCDC